MNDETRLHLGELYTQPLDADAADHPTLTGTGQFRIPVTISRAFFEQAGDKYGLFKTTMAQHLASAIFDTQAPAEMWYFKATREVYTQFHLPETMQMKR